MYENEGCREGLEIRGFRGGEKGMEEENIENETNAAEF